MRQLTDHIVSGDQAVQLEIVVTDAPGAGGACHEYRIRGIFSKEGMVPLSKLTNVEVLEDGRVCGDLCAVSFQDGPIKEFGVNGITQEALLAIVIDRLRSFQAGHYACEENRVALTYCEAALKALQTRTLARIKRGVEGTNEK